MPITQEVTEEVGDDGDDDDDDGDEMMTTDKGFQLHSEYFNNIEMLFFIYFFIFCKEQVAENTSHGVYCRFL